MRTMKLANITLTHNLTTEALKSNTLYIYRKYNIRLSFSNIQNFYKHHYDQLHIITLRMNHKNKLILLWWPNTQIKIEFHSFK